MDDAPPEEGWQAPPASAAAHNVADAGRAFDPEPAYPAEDSERFAPANAPAATQMNAPMGAHKGEHKGEHKGAPDIGLTSPLRPAPVQSATALQRSALGERWALLVQPLVAAGSVVALVRELAVQAELVALDASLSPPLARLRVERDTLRNPGLVEKLQAALAAAGSPMQLELEAGVALDSVALREAERAQARQREAEDTIRQDPLVQQLLSRIPGARIVPGTIRPL
jgi:DNA polymerase-3 subunit gamma/tau